MFDVDVCAVLSPFTHVTVVPTDTVSGLTPNAVVVNVDAPLGIVAVAVGPDGVRKSAALLMLLRLRVCVRRRRSRGLAENRNFVTVHVTARSRVAAIASFS